MTVALPGPLASSAPVFVAPMAGGPSRPELIVAADAAGHFAQLAGGYRTVEAMRDEISRVQAAGVSAFGVNLFVPGPPTIDATTYRAFASVLRAVADDLGVADLPDMRHDDDDWNAKVSSLIEDPVPAVSFTFGLPDARTVDRLRSAGSLTMQTVTSVGEALAASERGIDVLVVQGHGAGGHSGVFDPRSTPRERPLADLVRDVAHAVRLPVIATGGIFSRTQVQEALAAGAAAVAVGTAVLASPESGASALHKAAVLDPAYERTVLTRAFTGRPARALENRFVREFSDVAPVGYPALHHLTKPLRVAAAAAHDPSNLNLWAGTGWRHTRAEPLSRTLSELLPG